MFRYYQALALAICYVPRSAAQTSTSTTPTGTQCSLNNANTGYSVTSTPLATNLASCERFSGNVLISNPHTSGAVFDLSGLRTISDGGLGIYYLPNGTVKSTTPLDIATGYLVNGTEGGLLVDLDVLSAGAWYEVNYYPPVQDFPADPTVQPAIGSVLLLQNSSRSSANFLLTNGTDVTITDCPLLQNISLSGSIPGNTTIRASGSQLSQGGSSVDIGNMTTMNNVAISDAASISMKPHYPSTISLSQITGDLRIVNNSITDLWAPSLQIVSHSLLVVDNNNLSFLSLPAVSFVGGDLRITGISLNETSTQPRILHEGTSDFTMPALSHVGGSLVLSGSFTGFQLSSLSSVGGNIAINTTRFMDCQAAARTLSPLTSKSFTCRSANDAYTNVISNSTTTTTTSGGSQLSSGVKAGIGIGVSLGVLACAVLIFCILRRRKRSRARRHDRHTFAKSLVHTYQYDQPQQIPMYGKAELPHNPVRREMGEDEAHIKAPQELVATQARQSKKKIPVTSVLVEAPGDTAWHARSVPQQVTPASLTSSDGVTGTGSNGISPMSSPSVRQSRTVRGLSPLSSPSSSQSLRQTSASHDRPVSAVSAHHEHQAVQGHLATVEERG